MVGVSKSESPIPHLASRALAPPHSSARKALLAGLCLVAVSAGIVAFSSLAKNGQDELLALSQEQAVSRRAVLGDGMIDGAWSDVWNRKPAQYRAVSQELASYDEVGSQSLDPASNRQDTSQSKAETELADYSRVLNSAMSQPFRAKQRVSTDPKSLAAVPADKWSTKEQLEDAAAHDQELKSYSSILDFPFPAYRASFDSHKSPAKLHLAVAAKSEETEKSELGRYNVLNFPASTLKAAGVSPQAAPSAPQAAVTSAMEAPKKKLAVAQPAATKAAHAAVHAAPTAPVESKKYAHVTPFTGLLELPYARVAALPASPSPPQPSSSALLLEPPAAGAPKALQREWSKVWSEAQRLAAMAAGTVSTDTHPATSTSAQTTQTHSKAVSAVKTQSNTEAAASVPAPAVNEEAATESVETSEAKAASAQASAVTKAETAGHAASGEGDAGREERCAACRAVWSAGARACVERECASLSLSGLDAQQLRINDGVAALLQRYLGPDAGSGTRQVLVEGFVRPVAGGNEVPGWVEARGEDAGLKGLGLASGRTTSLAIGSVQTLSARRLAAPGSDASLQEALEPLMEAQRALNRERVRAGAHVLEGFQPAATLLAWRPHPGFALPKPAPPPAARPPAPSKLASAVADKDKTAKEPEVVAPAAAATQEGSGAAGLSSDSVLRGLQLKARALRAQLRRKPAARLGGEKRGGRGGERVLALVLAEKLRELRKMEAARPAKATGAGATARVKQTLTSELRADEGRLAAVSAEQRREKADGRLVAAAAKEARLERQHAALLATLRELKARVAHRRGAADKAPEQMLAQAPQAQAHRQEGAVGEAARLAGKAQRLGRALAKEQRGRGRQAAQDMDAKLTFLRELLASGPDEVEGRAGQAARERMEGLVGEAEAAAARMHRARGGRRGVQSLLAEAAQELQRAGQGGGGVVGGGSKRRALQAKAARERRRRAEGAEAAAVLRKRRAVTLGGDSRALRDDDASAQASQHTRGAVTEGGEGDGRLRADVAALLGATKVAEPKEYDAMLGAAVAREAQAVSRFRQAQRFASSAVHSQLETADHLFDHASNTPPPARGDGDPAVAAAMRSARRIEREMHIAFPHADERRAEARAAREKAAEERRRQEQEGKFIPGIGHVTKGREGRESLSSELWRHHYVPVSEAVAQAAPPLHAPSPSARQPRLAADGTLRAAQHQGASKGPEPSGWAVASKGADSALSESKEVEGAVAKGLGWALGGFTHDAQAKVTPTSSAGNSLWSYV